jgi:hypothetical protein
MFVGLTTQLVQYPHHVANSHPFSVPENKQSMSFFHFAVIYLKIAILTSKRLSNSRTSPFLLSVSTTCFSSFFVLPYTQFQIY